MEERRVRRAHGTCRWLILGLGLAFQARFARADVVARGRTESDDEFMDTLMADDL